MAWRSAQGADGVATAARRGYVVGKPCEAPLAPSAPTGAASAVEPRGGSAPAPRAPDVEPATAGAAQAGAAEYEDVA